MADWDDLVEPARSALETLISKGDAMADDRDYAAELMARIAQLENHIEDVAKDTHKIMVAYEAAIPAAYRLGLADARMAALSLAYDGDHAVAIAIRAKPTPTPAELMARIQTGEKK